MKREAVNIDFNAMAKAVRLYVREKAVQNGNTIVYINRGQIIEENPQTHNTRILKREYSL